jgi:ATP-binding cassette, subfamily B, bacterial
MFHGGGGLFFWLMREPSAQKVKLDIVLVRRVLAYAKPYRPKIAAVLVCILTSAGLGLLSPLLFRSLIDVALPNKDGALVNLLAVGLVAVPLGTAVVNILQRYLTASIGEGVIYELRVALYGHLQKMSLRFFTNTRSGELISRLNNDVIGAQSAINTTIVSIITNSVIVAGTLLVMLGIEWRLTLLGLAVVPLFVLPVWQIGKRLRAMIRQSNELNAQMNATLAETLNISGALLVKLFGRRAEEVSRFGGRAADVRDIGVRRAVMSNIMFALLGLISAMGVGLAYGVGGQLALEGVFTPGLIVAFGLYLGQVYGPLQALATAPSDFATSMVSFERVFEVIDLPIEIPEKAGALALATVDGAVRFEEVSFQYGAPEGAETGTLKAVNRGAYDAQRGGISGERVAEGAATSQARAVALNGISFAITPGQLVALVGPSGAGKTTLTYLLPRLYDPTSGAIYLDGHDLRDLTLDSLSAAIGMVTQETYLFHDSIKTNLLYANPQATEAQMIEAAKAAHIHNFIMELPEGYQTMVGERGYRLSGGEKQRMAIARVILKDPRLLVLDEATSSLDSQSEAAIKAALKMVMQGRTSIVIAHRLSTILAADLILVMDRGRIVERGTHKTLLSQGGLYASLYETQFKGDMAPS